MHVQISRFVQNQQQKVWYHYFQLTVIDGQKRFVSIKNILCINIQDKSSQKFKSVLTFFKEFFQKNEIKNNNEPLTFADFRESRFPKTLTWSITHVQRVPRLLKPIFGSRATVSICPASCLIFPIARGVLVKTQQWRNSSSRRNWSSFAALKIDWRGCKTFFSVCFRATTTSQSRVDKFDIVTNIKSR